MPNYDPQDTKETLMAVLLLIILVCVINPGHFWMPDMMTMSLSVLLLVVFGLFASFVWRERAGDEREQLHKLLAGHTAFLIGSGILSLGLLVQTFQHAVDVWLAITLGAMILMKLGGMMWARRKQ